MSDSSPQPHASAVAVLLALVAPDAPHLDRAPEADWPAVLALAEEHWLAPLLHARLEGVLAALPEPVRAALQRARTDSAAHTMLNEWEQAAVLRAFQAEQIPLLLFKGIPLARQLFDDPALRRTCDIDVIVRAADLPTSRRLLEANGWTPREAWQSFTDKNLDYVKDINGTATVLEVHWSTQRPGEYDLPEARLWAEAVETEEGWLFTREMTLLALVLHTVRHAFRPYRQLVDIAHALARWNEELDWPRLLSLAAEANAVPILATVLALVHRDLGAPLPHHPALRQRLLSRRIQMTIRLLPASQILLRPSPGQIERYGIPLASGAWRPALFFITDLLRTPRQIAEIYNLSERSPLIPLYYLLRPFLLLQKHLWQRLVRPRPRP